MTVRITLAPSTFAWPFHKVFTRPYVKVNGNDTVTHLSWGRTEDIDVDAGQKITAGFSYRFNLEQRLGETPFGTLDAATTHIRGKLGPLNSSPFHFSSQ